MKTIEIENKAVREMVKLLKKYAMSPLMLSLHIGITPARISEIFSNKRRVTADTDLRLCKFFNLKSGHFLRLQIEYDLELKELLIADKLGKIKTVDEVLK